MALALVEFIVHWFGGLATFAALGILLAGIWRGMRQPAGRTSGHTAGWFRSPVFYLFSTVLFVGISAALWRPLPLKLSTQARAWTLALGSLAYFPGIALILWGRLALGKMYFVSISFGAQLYADHKLVTRGPYAIVRHPMYLGLISAAFGSHLIYRTWTTVLFASFAPFLLRRARREEQALAAEFGQQRQTYCHCVPAFLPSLRKVE